MSSYILGLGVKGGEIIDAGDYYNVFIRGVDEEDDYTGDGLMINILRSLVRGILLAALFTISFLVSKKVTNTEKTSPYSIVLFLVIISSILPILLGFFLEPKCLLKQAKKDTSEVTAKCYIFDKHGGIYMHIIYVLICALIILGKDN